MELSSELIELEPETRRASRAGRLLEACASISAVLARALVKALHLKK